MSGRRRYLTAVAAMFGGCLGVPTAARDDGNGDEERSTEPRTDATTVPLAEQGYPADVCSGEIDPGGIRAIDAPAFESDWSGIEVRREYGDLSDDEVVIAVERGGKRRAYPLSVLRKHEVVNDRLGGPLLVTYCPLCRSGLVADRRIDGEPTAFGVTGQLWRAPKVRAAARVNEGDVLGAMQNDPDADVKHRGNLLLYDDATRSYWSQILARAICGPMTGTRLRVVPASVVTWGTWRSRRAGGDVLLPPPHSEVR